MDDHAASRTPAAAMAVGTALWPFRVLALAGAVIQSYVSDDPIEWRVVLVTTFVGVYTIARIVRPIPYRNDPLTTVQIVIEQALMTAVVVIDGGWASPFALCLIPTSMLTGLSLGPRVGAQMGAASIVIITVQHLPQAGVTSGIRDGLLWAGLLGIVTYTSGMSHRAAVQAAQQERSTLERVSRLAEANSLLFALQRVTQSMPASLDLQDVVDSSFDRLQRLLPGTSLTLHLLDETEQRLDLVRHAGPGTVQGHPVDSLPHPLRSVLEAPRTLRLDELDGRGLAEGMHSGLYSALRARGTTIGVLTIESETSDRFTPQHAEMVHGLAETFGIALDNARLFRQIRAVAADEERRRIARDLHDRIGSSLAFLGFEVDRARELSARGELTPEQLDELRAHVTSMVRDIRETLFDLRTDVSDEQDLPATVEDLLDRVMARSGIETRLVADIVVRPPIRVEREIYRITFEAISNVERHAAAAHLDVTYRADLDTVSITVADDGIGMRGDVATDRYGLVGMRERAERIGGHLTITSPADPTTGRGTIVSVQAPIDERSTR